MGNLPKAKCPTRTLDVGGEPLELTGLTRGQLHAVNAAGAGDPAKFEISLVGFACGVTYDEAAEWLDSIPAGIAQEVVEAAMELSGLGDVPKASS